MLNRQEILEIEGRKNLESSIRALICTLALSYPNIIEDGEAGNDERFAMAEHMIHRFFLCPSAQAVTGGALELFAQTFKITPDEMTEMAKRTREDLETLDVPEEEIAITAIFVWFVDACKQHGDYFTEFEYFIYAISNSIRGDEQFKQDGANELKKAASKNPALKLLAHIFKIA